MRRTSPAFPVGLYGMLLFALAWLTLPAVFAPIERVLVGASCAVGRLWTGWIAAPARDASPGATRRFQQLALELEQRLAAHAAAGAPPDWTAGLEPIGCAVVGVGRRGGGGGAPSELRLDHSHAELADCRVVVTKGDAFVGVLQRPGTGVALTDGPDDPARVVLPSHVQARPLHAEVCTDDGGWLRFVVRAAATVDPAPLRVELWDDPYRAARLDRTGLPVRTRQVEGTVSPVPAGLLVGTTRVWGYPRTADGDALTLGVFVAPALAPRALSRVVVWRPVRGGADGGAGDTVATATATATARTVRTPAFVGDLPGAVHGRHLLVGAGTIADGAAVEHDGVLLGTGRGLAFGMGLVTSFAASRHRWTLLLLPDDPTLPPEELSGEVVRVDGERVAVRVLETNGDTSAVAHRRGHLFTGSNGPHCPAGLWIGRATPARHHLAQLEVALLPTRGVRQVAVHRGRELP